MGGCVSSESSTEGKTVCYMYMYIYFVHVQWNLGIRDTQGTVNTCPEFWGGLIS